MLSHDTNILVHILPISLRRLKLPILARTSRQVVHVAIQHACGLLSLAKAEVAQEASITAITDDSRESQFYGAGRASPFHVILELVVVLYLLVVVGPIA